MNQELQEYIKVAREAGETEEEIKNNLLKAGWEEEQVKQGLANVPPKPEAKEEPPSEQPNTQESDQQEPTEEEKAMEQEPKQEDLPRSESQGVDTSADEIPWYKSNKFFWIAAGSLIVALVILAGLLLFGNSGEKEEFTPNTPEAQEQSAQTALDSERLSTIHPEKISSIDTSNNSFVLLSETQEGPVETTIKINAETVIKKGPDVLEFEQLSADDVVWIRGVKEDGNTYLAKSIIVTNDWRSSEVIIKSIDTLNKKITAEIFLPPNKRGETVVLTIIPETIIKKGAADEGDNRKIVNLQNLEIGDIAGIFEIGNGVHPADDKGPFYVTDIDVVSPYYCQEFLKPSGCIEKEQESQQATPTQSQEVSGVLYQGSGFLFKYPNDWQVEYEYSDVVKLSPKMSGEEKLALFLFFTKDPGTEIATEKTPPGYQKSTITLDNKEVAIYVGTEQKSGENQRQVILEVPDPTTPGEYIVFMASCGKPITQGQCSTAIDNIINNTVIPSFKFD